MIIQINMDIKYDNVIIKYFKSYITVIIQVNKKNAKRILDLPSFSIPSVFDYVPQVSRACACAK